MVICVTLTKLFAMYHFDTNLSEITSFPHEKNEVNKILQGSCSCSLLTMYFDLRKFVSYRLSGQLN